MTIEATLTEILQELQAIRRNTMPVAGTVTLTPPAPPPVVPLPPTAVASSTVVVAPPPTVQDTLPLPVNAFAQIAPATESTASPAAPLTVSPAPLDTVERDSKGMPWDGRIHASSKAKVADGSWRAKRGVEDALVAQVTAELTKAAAAPAFDGQPWPFDAPAVIPTPGGAPVITFIGLMTALPAAMSAGKVTNESLMMACAAVGVDSLPALGSRPDLVPAVAAALGITAE